MKNRNQFSFIIKEIIRKQKVLTGCMVLLIAGAIGLALVPPLVLEKIVNLLTEKSVVSIGLILLYFGTLAVSGFFETAQNVLITSFGQKMTHGLRKEMCEKLSRLPAAYYSEHESGEITSRMVNDVDTVDALFSNGIISMFADACKVLGILAVIFWKSIGLGILMLLITPLLFGFTRAIQKRMLKAQIANREAVGRVNNHIPETIRNIRMIHSLFREEYMEKKYDQYIQESYKAVDRSNVYDSVYSPVIIFTGSCVIAVMMICSAMGGQVQMFFGMSVGTAVAVTAYVGKVFVPLESIGMEIQNIQSAIAGVRRICEFLEEEETQTKETEQTDRNDISFEHVSFGYEPGQYVLKDVSFALQSGECVTLMGRTGAGKSTVLRLLLGLYLPDQGQITVGGIAPQFITEERRREMFGYVEQSFRLVTGTVAEQITLFDNGITQDRIEWAAKLAGIHETILTLDQGYETRVTDTMFSQGQFQLLSIARAIVTNPRILLLDEITANLDSDTEHRVMEALKNACRNRTVISVSHRLYEQNMGGRQIEIGS